MSLERFQRREHDADAALHVRDAGPVQSSVGAGGHRLEGAVGGKDRVIVAGQDDLNRRVGPGADPQGVRMGLGADRAVVADEGRTLCLEAHDLSGQARRLGLKDGQHPGQSLGVATAGVEVRPVDRPADDGALARRDMVEHDLFGGQNPHVGGP